MQLINWRKDPLIWLSLFAAFFLYGSLYAPPIGLLPLCSIPFLKKTFSPTLLLKIIGFSLLYSILILSFLTNYKHLPKPWSNQQLSPADAVALVLKDAQPQDNRRLRGKIRILFWNKGKNYRVTSNTTIDFTSLGRERIYQGSLVFLKGIEFSETGLEAEELELLRSPPGIWKIRQKTWEFLLNKCKAWPSEEQALWQALVLGYRGNLEASLIQDFRLSGAAPLLALSGLHLGMLVFLCRLIPIGFLQTFMRISIACFFLFFTGISPSLLRAALMITAGGVWSLFSIKPTKGSILGTSFLIQTGLFPQDLFTLGFQLSYLALIGLFLLEEPIRFALTYILPKIPSRILAPGLSIQILTAPLLLYQFRYLPWIGILSNLILLPCIASFMLVGAICMILPASLAPIYILEAIYTIFRRILEALSQVPPLYLD